MEETGYSARKWSKLASFWVSPGYVEERMTIFLATDLTEGEATPMDDERIETRWFKRKEVAKMIATASWKTPRPWWASSVAERALSAKAEGASPTLLRCLCALRF